MGRVDMHGGFARIWVLLKATVAGFLDDEALTRGAAIAFYTATSFAPLLLIVISIAGLAIGREAAQSAVIGELGALLGPTSADFLRNVTTAADNKAQGLFSAAAGFAALALAATGIFGEMQSALNRIWKVQRASTGIASLVRARAASAGLVAVLGFLLVVSLAVSTALTALSGYIDAALPLGKWLIWSLNSLVSISLLALMFAAIYKVLPDCALQWRDVAVGALSTAILFTLGKSLIGWYLGSGNGASAYGAAGALILLLLWVYYSVQIFLLGAEFTRAFGLAFGSHKDGAVRDQEAICPMPRLTSY